MDKELIELVQSFATKEHKDVILELHDKSKDNLISILTALLSQYFNDTNSSALRELVVVVLCGFEPILQKLGYNGYRQIGFGGGRIL